jgi:protein-tyrosine phosphatase
MIQNMRDLGGLPAGDGRKIRPGMLIRSAQLAQADAEDLEHVAAVIDLRTIREREEMPDRVHSCRYLPMPVFDEFKPGVSHEGEADRQRLPDMAVLYGILVRNYADSFRKILTAIMQHDFSEGAVLWHCTEGKDRCGMTAALVLEALGVSRDAIMRDYLETNRTSLLRARGVYERLLPLRGEVFARSVYRAYVADERYLRAAWDAMGENFLTDTLHIPQQEIDAFREQVLE